MESFTSLSRKNYYIHDGNEPKTFVMNINTKDKSIADTLYEWFTEARLCVLSIEDVAGAPELYSVVIEEYSCEDDGEFFNCALSLVECEGIIEVRS